MLGFFALYLKGVDDLSLWLLLYRLPEVVVCLVGLLYYRGLIFWIGHFWGFVSRSTEFNGRDVYNTL